MTFYLKYRPKNLDELDLVNVSGSLKKIVKSKNIPHAFLFAGPKGTGKTSAARILAKIINCESKNPPCGKCNQCLSITKGNNLDVIELDAASNRGIDDIRLLRDAVKLSPTKAKKKIYIIDEVHMLTTEASNALLKTLEEPPNHVIFILATTNAEKLISTIRSRTTEILFTKADNDEIKTSLKRVIRGEKIKISPEIIDLIIQNANGSFRDAVKLLEQFSIEGNNFLKSQKSFNTEDFVQNLLSKNKNVLLKQVKELEKNGASFEEFIKNILEILRTDIKQENILLIEYLMEAVRTMSFSPIEVLPLEIAIIKWCQLGGNEESKMQDHEDEEVKTNEKSNSAFRSQESNIDDDTWKSILGAIRPVNASIEALLRAAKPLAFDGKILKLGVFYKFHKERLEDGQQRKILEDIVGQVLGGNTRVDCILTEPPVRAPLTESQDQDIIKVAEEIFGN